MDSGIMSGRYTTKSAPELRRGPSSVRAGVDLHMHTIASDGTDSPGEVVRKAAGSGLSAIAITDHDTVFGVAAALSEATAWGVEVVPGIELSARFEPVMHILGLSIDIGNEDLAQALGRLDRIRMRLITRAFKAVKDCGITVSPKELLKSKQAITLVNLRDYLLENNLMHNSSELGLLLASYLEKWIESLPGPHECISLIHSCGGLAILAHPKLLRRPDRQLKDILVRLKSNGLDGIEVVHPEHTQPDTEKYVQWAGQMDLLCSGGSDYHGKGCRCAVASDWDSAGLFVSPAYLEAMMRRLEGKS